MSQEEGVLADAFENDGTSSRPLSAKEKRLRKLQCERDFRSEVRSLKAISRRLVVACADRSSSSRDLEIIQIE